MPTLDFEPVLLDDDDLPDEDAIEAYVALYAVIMEEERN